MGVAEEEDEEEAPAGALDDVADAPAVAEARFFREPERESTEAAAAAEGVEAPLPPPPMPPMPMPPMAAKPAPALGVTPVELPALPVERADDGPIIDAGRPLSVETSRRGSGGRED